MGIHPDRHAARSGWSMRRRAYRRHAFSFQNPEGNFIAFVFTCIGAIRTPGGYRPPDDAVKEESPSRFFLALSSGVVESGASEKPNAGSREWPRKDGVATSRSMAERRQRRQRRQRRGWLSGIAFCNCGLCVAERSTGRRSIICVAPAPKKPSRCKRPGQRPGSHSKLPCRFRR